MIYRLIYLSIAFCLISGISYGQFGLNVRYSTNDFNDWSGITTAASGGPIWESNLEFALDYWFKPSEYRAEYYLEGSYANTKTTFGNRVYQLNSYGFGVKSNIYILDFKGDCDCPTFKKEGGLFKKGFFLQWNAHGAYWNKQAEFLGDSDTNIAFDLGAGAGIDIGISDLLTITPYATWQYYPWLTWEQFGLRHGIGGIENLNAKTTVTMIKFGVRIGFRPDFLKEQRVLRR